MDIYRVGNHPPFEYLVVDAAVLDLRAAIRENRVGLADVDIAGVVGRRAVVLRTGWEQHFGSDRYAACPDVEYDLVDALLDGEVRLLLVDSPGVFGGAKGPNHAEMDGHIVSRGGFAVEHLCNLEGLPPEFALYCVPLNVIDRNALPARVFASW